MQRGFVVVMKGSSEYLKSGARAPVPMPAPRRIAKLRPGHSTVNALSIACPA